MCAYLTTPKSRSPLQEPRRDSSGAVMTCADCNGALCTKDDALVALGRRWHDGCFKCAGCRTPLGSTETFAEHDGMAFHLGCVPTPEAEPCRACGQPVRGEYVRVADDKYHARCLLAYFTILHFYVLSPTMNGTTRGALWVRACACSTMAMATPLLWLHLLWLPYTH